ncbi:hypothetical protein Q8A67_005617 [Cirrhinus molitorella]|uniref:Uncharacterized protein n=1 Tax=Cirrhinus molitorella TaxID=172907 RepID=A0AA88Q3P4_9TELE|nr:hypothetical protein Q8A67_005617 [Cirrhinus molitorella]
MRSLNSSWMAFGPSTLPNTIIFSHGNMLEGNCGVHYVNATVKDNTFHTDANGIVSVGNFLPSCPDCLTVNFISHYNNETIKTLYFTKRDNNRTESDVDMYLKQAECLGFQRESHYSYNGVTEICREVTDSSSEQKPSLDKSV